MSWCKGLRDELRELSSDGMAPAHIAYMVRLPNLGQPEPNRERT
jgi:hypothetical protein